MEDWLPYFYRLRASFNSVRQSQFIQENIKIHFSDPILPNKLELVEKNNGQKSPLINALKVSSLDMMSTLLKE